MRASTIFGAGVAILFAGVAAAQPVNQPQRPPPRQPGVVIIERPQLPVPPERQVNPPRSYQEMSPPMQGPTPLSPMAPRVGNGG